MDAENVKMSSQSFLRPIVERQGGCAHDANRASGATHSVKKHAAQCSLHSGFLCLNTRQVCWP